MELPVDDISLDPSSIPCRFVIKPGGKEPGPDGEGMCLLNVAIPGDGALRGGVALPIPESISSQNIKDYHIIRARQLQNLHIF